MNMERRRFTEEERELAKSIDLCDVAASLGYTVKRVGHCHTLAEMDSVRIYNRKSWFRWSREHESSGRGGSQIDFLMTFAGMEAKEAVFWLLDFAGYRSCPEGDKKPKLKHQIRQVRAEEKKEFVLPAAAQGNRHLYGYLCDQRAVSRDVVNYFVKKGLIYEEAHYHNIVFKGNDKDGNTRFASMRGVFDRNGRAFKCDVAGNDKRYGFNVFRERSDEVVVSEAAIDIMSYMDIFQDYENSLLALGMLSDAPLTTFLSEHPQIQSIKFCLDNDEPGRKASEALMQKYYELGYDVEDKPPPEGCKDYNEWLQKAKHQPVAWERKQEMCL